MTNDTATKQNTPRDNSDNLALSVIVPVHNEEKNIVRLATEISDILLPFIPHEIIYVDEICQYDSATEIMKVKWIYYSSNKQDQEYQFTMRMYYPDTMNRLLIDSGLTITNLWGDYELNDFHQDSEMQIYECTYSN